MSFNKNAYLVDCWRPLEVHGNRVEHYVILSAGSNIIQAEIERFAGRRYRWEVAGYPPNPENVHFFGRTSGATDTLEKARRYANSELKRRGFKFVSPKLLTLL